MDIILSYKRHKHIHKAKIYFIPLTLLCKNKNNIDVFNFDIDQIKTNPDSGFSMVYIYEHLNENKKIVMKLMTIFNDKIKQELNFYKYISKIKNYNLYICGFRKYVKEKYENNEYHYLFLEYLERDIFDFMFRDQVEYSLYEAIDILKQVARCLLFLHKHNIIYNDLKVENIMITNEKPYKVKLIDFNCITSLKNKNNLLNNIGSGTLAYMSPDLQNCIKEKNFKKLTFKSDCWGFGILICNFLTNGLNLYESKISDLKTIKNIQENKYENKETLIEYFDKNCIFEKNKYIDKLVLLCHKCFKTNPKERLNLQKILDYLLKISPDTLH